MKRVITFGTFDLLHEGHIKILERARSHGDYLVVGVSTDALNARKGKSALFSQEQRRAHVDALEVVDETFFEESLALKDAYIKTHRADLLVMGDDWEGRFDWVSCDVKYLPRTPDVSSSALKGQMLQTQQCRRVLFGDTYIKKHYDCALSMVNEMLDANIAPVFTQTRELPRHLQVDCLAYFNRPSSAPPPEYDVVPRVCIDHGASNLKWFLADKDRFLFFDRIITAGPDHSKSLMTFFPETHDRTKVHSAGFIKSSDLLSPPKFTRKEVCEQAGLKSRLPITLFVPTWYITRNVDIQVAIDDMAGIKNHVAVLHPETRHLDVGALNVIENTAGMVTELMKHADCIVSDLSSTIFEAAPLGKPVVQILMREYSDNNSTNFDYPYVAGTADLFCGGLTCRPDNLRKTVKTLLDWPARFRPFMDACQKRVMAGTVMDDGVSKAITSELLIASRDQRPPRVGEPEVESIRVRGLAGVQQNLSLSRTLIIGHGGGNFQRHHASNSREAIGAAFSATRMVEVDLVRGADNILLAHDGYAEKYGLDRPFNEVTAEAFSAARFNGALTTFNIDEFLDQYPPANGYVVFDIKNTDQEYVDMLTSLHERVEARDLLDRVIVQAYSRSDFEAVTRIGFRRTILAVWKYYNRAPLGEDAYRFISDCIGIDEARVYGISIPHYNHHMPRPSIEMDELLPFFAFWKRVFIHGAPQACYPDILRRNMGIFADAFKQGIEFRQAPGQFNWRDYMFLNPGLVADGIDNQVSATCHYVEWGKKEGRPITYTTPEGFTLDGYLAKNQDLRRVGVSGPNSAKAHWTRQGASQSRSF